MTVWQPHLLLEDELKKADERLAVTDDIELRFDRAVTLSELGRLEEAKNAYIELLGKAPAHFGALNNLGALLMALGFRTAACTAYAEAIKHHPDNPMAHINLANAQTKNGETESALQHFHAALRIDPDHYEAHRGLSHLLSDIGHEEQAQIHRAKGFKDRPVMVFPYRGKALPVAVLVLASARGGTVPIKHHLDESVFFTSVLFVDFYNPDLPFPPHHLVFNAIGDADICKDALEAAVKILAERSTAPVINPPGAILATGRAANAERFAHIPGVITPNIQLLSRQALADKKDCIFPFLLRPPGFHTGRFFMRIDNEEALAPALAAMPGDELMVIQYLDARSKDGAIRKYRVMMIDGVIYPLHVAISREWKIHYFSAGMADNPDNRAEDAAFLQDMTRVLGKRAVEALVKIADTLGLDYAGADFSLSPDGDVILFEANATMVVNPPDADSRWDYRRPAVQKILDAIRALLVKHAPGH